MSYINHLCICIGEPCGQYTVVQVLVELKGPIFVLQKLVRCAWAPSGCLVQDWTEFTYQVHIQTPEPVCFSLRNLSEAVLVTVGVKVATDRLATEDSF